ncbi:hypothetical protein [Ascidiimonas sp. W6]|uniref:hypothetical protein n=1 Tax=Ascidiimonas meishanensis TaxID=3128903 RepID=UPI0030EF8CDE
MKQLMDSPYLVRLQAELLTKEELKNIKGAAERMDSFENGMNSDCLSTFCNATRDCTDVHCGSCEPHNSNGGICMP